MAKVDEIVRRKAPDLETIRELFVKSGNECAFPGCTHRIINEAGVFIAQICHIEAAQENGERFNEEMTNEERAAFSNLMLMCYEHHVITNDVEKYSVAVLQKMKAEHEAKYTSAPETISKSIIDEAQNTVTCIPRTFARFNSVLGWRTDPEQVASEVADVTELISRLKQVPKRTRQLFSSIVRRVGESSIVSQSTVIPFVEVVMACGLEQSDVFEQLKILERYKIAYGDNSDCGDYAVIRVCKIGIGPWDIWADVKKFCERSGLSIEAIVVDLRFDLFD